MSSNSSNSINTGDLSPTDGLLILVTRALDKLSAGETLNVLSGNASVQHDLPAWCRLNGHRFLGTTVKNGRWQHRIEKGTVIRVLMEKHLDWGNRAPIQNGRFDTRNWLLGHAAHIQQTAQQTDGFAPRGASVE